MHVREYFVVVVVLEKCKSLQYPHCELLAVVGYLDSQQTDDRNPTTQKQ